MAKFLEVTGYKGEKILINAANIKTVAEFSVPEGEGDHLEEKRILDAKAIISMEDGQVPVIDTYESIVRRLVD